MKCKRRRVTNLRETREAALHRLRRARVRVVVDPDGAAPSAAATGARGGARGGGGGLVRGGVARELLRLLQAHDVGMAALGEPRGDVRVLADLRTRAAVRPARACRRARVAGEGENRAAGKGEEEARLSRARRGGPCAVGRTAFARDLVTHTTGAA